MGAAVEAVYHRVLLHGRSTDGRFIQGPFGPIRAHMGPCGAYMGPYGPIWAHIGPYGPIWGPCGPIWARMGPARAHAPHKTISEINLFFQRPLYEPTMYQPTICQHPTILLVDEFSHHVRPQGPICATGPIGAHMSPHGPSPGPS